jgi:hypothetical protein
MASKYYCFKAINSLLFLTANPLKKSDILLNVVFSGINNRNWFLNVVNLETNHSVQGITDWTGGNVSGRMLTIGFYNKKRPYLSLLIIHRYHF